MEASDVQDKIEKLDFKRGQNKNTVQAYARRLVIVPSSAKIIGMLLNGGLGRVPYR